MRRLIASVGVVCTTALICTGVFADDSSDVLKSAELEMHIPPAQSDNPNEVTRDSFKPPPYGAPIDLADAKAVAAAAVKFTENRGWNSSCISVVGPSGDLIYFERQDNCQFASIEISEHKARTAARFRRPTLVFERLLGKGPYYIYQMTLDGVMASRGGVPLLVDGKVVGAIGVSGGTGSDGAVSQAAADWFNGQHNH